MNKHGLSLIEILVSIALIGTIFIIFCASLSSIYSQQYSELEGIAYGIAEAELEIIRTLSSASTTNRINANFIGIIPEHDAWQLLKDGQGFLTIEDWQENTDIKQITAQAQWKDNRGTRSVELKTLIRQ